jgi:hypothetical protein
MLIPVIYSDGKHDLVKDFTLSQLIVERSIVKFKRKQGWVDIDSDKLRKSDQRSVYFGRERRHDFQNDIEREAVL